MRVREAAWRTIGPALGGLAPRATHAYYAAVSGSLVRALARRPDVRAVYAHGSFALGELQLGESDVDLFAVVDDASVEGEVGRLGELRAPYGRRQAILPLDLYVAPRSEFRLAAPWHAFMRMRIGVPAPACPVERWRLLAGDECRAGEWRPDPRLSYLTERHVLDALDACARRDWHAVGARLGKLARDARREQLDWPAATALQHARARLRQRGASEHDVVAALGAALEIVDEHRSRNAVPYETAVEPYGWSAAAVPPASVPGARRVATRFSAEPVRSLTLFLPPFERTPVLLLEARELEDARAVLRAAVAAAAEAASAGVRLQVLTSRLAEDAWRNVVRVVPLVAASVHLGGEPLAARVRLPAPVWRRQLALGRSLTAVAFVRWRLLGLRRFPRIDWLPFELAACRALVAGETPTTDPVELARRTPELAGLADGGAAALDDAALGAVCLRLWRSCLALVDEDDAFAPQPLAVE